MTENKPVYVGKDLESMSFAPNYHQWIMDEISLHPGLWVAEIGAGCGNFTKLLVTKSSRHVTAFEPSGNMFPALQEMAQLHDNLIHDNLTTENATLSEMVDSYKNQV